MVTSLYFQVVRCFSFIGILFILWFPFHAMISFVYGRLICSRGTRGSRTSIFIGRELVRVPVHSAPSGLLRHKGPMERETRKGYWLLWPSACVVYCVIIINPATVQKYIYITKYINKCCTLRWLGLFLHAFAVPFNLNRLNYYRVSMNRAQTCKVILFFFKVKSIKLWSK